MAMPNTARRYTVAEVLAFPEDGNRYEVVHGGLLVTPAPRPRHQAVLQRLLVSLHKHIEITGAGAEVFPSPADISWDDETLVQPDLFVVPRDEVSNDWSTFKTLLLAVEVVSPSSQRADRVIKRRLYQEQKVAAYWIVDVDAQVVEVWRPDDERPEIAAETLQWQVSSDVPELSIDLRELFKDLPAPPDPGR